MSSVTFQAPETEYTNAHQIERRFGGLQRLWGPEVTARLAAAHVAVVGLGGVGSWTAEALARCGVGALTLIDLDHVAPSNINRQIHALDSTLGQAKVEAMAQRVREIHPGCRVTLVDDFVEPDNVATVLSVPYSVIIDATDQVQAKVAMILQARQRRYPLIVCGGAGGKINPLALRVGDLSEATHDPLLARIRGILRSRHGYPRAQARPGKPPKKAPRMNVRVLWLDEPVRQPLPTSTCEVPAGGLAPWAPDPAGMATISSGLHTRQAHALPGPQGLSCAGYGSLVTVTATMGMMAAHEALGVLLQPRRHP